MTRDITLRATARRLTEMGYAPTSATNPDRFVSSWHACRREGLAGLADHPAAVMLWPLKENGALCDEPERRRLVDLTLTAYLLSDPKATKAVMAVLESLKLTGGPVRQDSFGNRHYVLQWNGEDAIYDQYEARLCFPSDDYTVNLVQAIRPPYVTVRTELYSLQRVPDGPPITHVIALDGEWRGGSLLDTPRSRLPELLQSDCAQLIDDIEHARWGVRPLATAKDAA